MKNRIRSGSHVADGNWGGGPGNFYGLGRSWGLRQDEPVFKKFKEYCQLHKTYPLRGTALIVESNNLVWVMINIVQHSRIGQGVWVQHHHTRWATQGPSGFQNMWLQNAWRTNEVVQAGTWQDRWNLLGNRKYGSTNEDNWGVRWLALDISNGHVTN